ncbi:Protein bric-a-brac 2 [Biomphalaria glabrata]|nr:Protein bric-a-brac 2 [Biomphalaria glabrata]
MEDECVESFVETKKNKKQFNYVTRYVIYRCLEYNVPVKAIAKVILVCSKIYSRNTSDIDLPVISTVAQMSREMGVIADLQVAEAVLQADGVTLSFDATTIKGNHINEIHFNTKEQSLTASVLMLPGGRAEDYVQHIMDTLEDLSITYSAFHKCEIQEVRNKMRGKILSTLTDRAAVNSATVNKLNDLLERQLLQLNCHLHPLDGIANETRKVLLESNSIIPSAVHGTDCRIANLLYAISKLRTALSTAILADLKNEHLIHQLQALGLWSKLVTGPWMALFYAAEGQRNHFDMVKHIKKALNFIQKVLDSPEVLYRSEMDAFDFPLLNNETLKSLLLINSTKYLNETIKVVAQATLNVLNRQYFRYLHGDLSDPSIQTKHMAASAPLHNVWAERTLGFYNLLYQKSPNAEMTFLDGKTKAKVNKALDWVSIKTIDEQEKILNFCLSRGAAARKLGKSRRKRNGEVIMHRLEESGQKRDTGKRKKLAKDIKDALQDSSVPILQTKHFTALSDQQKLRITDMLNENQLNILGSNIDHLWNLNGVDVLYRGKIVSRSKQFEESITFTISYWKYDEDAEDYTLPLIDLLCDIILGDLTFS